MTFTFKLAAVLLLFQSGLAFSKETTLTIDQSQNKYQKTQSFNLKTRVSGLNFVDGIDESKIVQLMLSPEIHYQLQNNFGFEGEVNINVTSGHTQTRFQNPNFNFINLQQAIVYYQPFTQLKLKAGAIDQSHFNNRMFIADRSFPGMYAESQWKFKDFTIKPNAQYAVPTSTSFESQRTEAEKVPALNTFGTTIDWSPNSWFKAGANINHFQFSNLPSIVAFNSGRWGNTNPEFDPSASYFLYDFVGFSQSYNINLSYTPSLQQNFFVTSVDNQMAPSDRSRSQRLGSGLKWDWRDYSFTPEWSTFYAESDSTPALYSAFELGRNNRRGYSLFLGTELKKLGVTIKAQFIETQLIEQQALQADIQVFDLALEFNNVLL